MHPYMVVGAVKVADGASPMSDCGKISVTAGELGLGKLAILSLSTYSSFKIGKTEGGSATPDGKDTAYVLEVESCESCGKDTLTTP